MKNRIADYLPTSWLQRKPGATLGSAASDSMKSWSEPVREFVVKNPGTSLAVAFAAGVAIAWWLKRR